MSSYIETSILLVLLQYNAYSYYLFMTDNMIQRSNNNNDLDLSYIRNPLQGPVVVSLVPKSNY